MFIFNILAVTFKLLCIYFAVMADRKGKPVTPMKTLTKKEQEELKKKVSRLGML